MPDEKVVRGKARLCLLSISQLAFMSKGCSAPAQAFCKQHYCFLLMRIGISLTVVAACSIACFKSIGHFLLLFEQGNIMKEESYKYQIKCLPRASPHHISRYLHHKQSSLRLILAKKSLSQPPHQLFEVPMQNNKLGSFGMIRYWPKIVREETKPF